jgi:iron complex transport system substrate-binding protein
MVTAVRIASLLPSATEIVAALGLGERLVGRTHECDFPPEVAGVPALTRSALECDPLDSAAIDAAVGGAVAGDGVYRLDEAALAAARPDLVITQDLCEVCAVDTPSVARALGRMPGAPRLITLEPETLADVLATIVAVGRAAGVEERAREVVAGLELRLERVRAAVAGLERPRVVAMEWLDPPWAAGHWVPDQVAAAGGREMVGEAGGRSARTSAAAIRDAEPDWLLLIPCGWNADQAVAALDRERFAAEYGETPAARSGRVVALDGSAYFSRPGPRLVDGVEILASLLHPEAGLAAPPGGAVRHVALPAVQGSRG